RAQRASDELGVFGVGAIDEDIEMPQPVQDTPGGERQAPDARIEAAVAIDPVEGECPRETALFVRARITEMPEPGERLQIVEPVVMDHVDGEGRGAIGVDELAG